MSSSRALQRKWLGGDEEPGRAHVVVVVASGQVEDRRVGSPAEAARSAADRKPICVSMVSVGRRLPVAPARRARVPTSRTSRREVARRQVVGVRVRVGRGRLDGRRRHDVRRRRRLQHPLGDASVLALHQAVRLLERLQVVVDLLPRDADPGGEPGGGGGLDGQLAEQRARTGRSAAAAACALSITSTSCIPPPRPRRSRLSRTLLSRATRAADNPVVSDDPGLPASGRATGPSRCRSWVGSPGPCRSIVPRSTAFL